MVGKTTQVREMIINRLDQTGERTIIDRAANKTDVFEKAQFQQQLGTIQGLTSGNFSNILVSQADITRIDGILSENNINPDSTAFDDLRDDHDSNATRIEILESVHLANALIVDNTFANVTVLQSNVTDITANVVELESNSLAMYTNVTTLQANVVSIENNIDTIESCVSAINASISGIANFGDVAEVAAEVDELNSRVVGTDFVKIGGGSTGEGTLGAQPTIVGINSGQNIGSYSIAIGYQTQNFSQPSDALDNTIFLNASGEGENPTRSSATYIAPIQEDNANVIAIMGSNTATHEIVTTSMLRLKDSDIQSNTNIKVYTNDYTSLKATISNDTGNSSFAGNMQNEGTLTVGGVSSFSGNMSIKDSSFLVGTKASINKDGTSSFAGVMSVNNAANFDGTVTFKNSGTEKAKINGTDGTSSFSGAMQVDNNATVDGSFFVKNAGATKAQILDDGTSSFAGAMQVNNDVTVDGSFLVKNGTTTVAKITDDGIGSFSSGLVSGTYTGYGTTQLKDANFQITDAAGSTVKSKLSNDGTSSFAGAMQVNNDATVDGSFLVASGGTTKAQILDDGTSSFAGAMTLASNLYVYGNRLTVYNGSTANINLNQDGTGSFASSLTINGSTNLYNDLNVYHGSLLNFKVDNITGNMVSKGTGSFGGTLEAKGVATMGSSLTVSSTGSFGGTLKVAGAATIDGSFLVASAGTTKAQILDDGTSSFAGDMKVDGTATLDDVTTSGTGSFGTLKCNGTATLNDVTTSGTGSFGTLKCNGTATLDDVTTSGTGSFGTLKVAGAATIDGSFLVASAGTTKAQILDDGTSSFAGDMKVDGTATLDDVTTSGTGSFGTLKCNGTATLDGVTTSGTGSFGTLECNGTATLDGVTTSGTGSFGTLECNGTATLDGVTTSGTGSFGTLECNGTATLDGVTTSGTGSFGTLKAAGATTIDGSFLVASAGTTKAQILDNGTSSFSGAMQVNSSVTVPNDGNFVMAGKKLKAASGLYWDSTNNRLGVNKAAPGVDIDVTGSVTASVTGSFGNISCGGTITGNLSGNVSGGTGSFSGAAVDGSFLVKNGNTTKAQILDDGTSSFAGNMSVNGTITATLSGNASSANAVNKSIKAGSYLTGSNFNGSVEQTWEVDATSDNTNSKVVARDASGNFSAGTITAALSGNASSANAVNNSIKAGSYLTGTDFNGSVEQTWEVDATSDNTNSKVVARDASGNFSAGTITAALSGNASSASAVNNSIKAGSYLTGADFNGSAEQTWAVDATSSNTNSKVVARDASGNFSAGTITAALSGNASSADEVNNSIKAGSYLTGTDFNGSAEQTWAVDATSSNTGSKVVARDASGNFSAGTITANIFQGTSGAQIQLVFNPDGGYWEVLRPTNTYQGTALGQSSRAFGKAYISSVYRNNEYVLSDDRLKTDEKVIDNATETILKLNPQTYTKSTFLTHYITDEEYSNVQSNNMVYCNISRSYVNRDDIIPNTINNESPWYARTLNPKTKKESGLIAQDVWYDCPELRYIVDVSYDANPSEEKPFTPEDIQQDPDYDAAGWGSSAASVNYTALISYLIKSIQELHERIKVLENRTN
jgi:hypothetical protein